jgi:hypothetical protein
MPDPFDQSSDQMTHQPVAAPVQPYMSPNVPPALQAIAGFLSGGLQGAGMPMPGWMQSNPVQAALQNPDNQTALGALSLRTAGRPGLNDRIYDLMNEQGKKVGSMSATWQPHRGEVYVSGMQSDLPGTVDPGSAAAQANTNAHSLGAANIRSIVEALKNEFPKAKAITAARSSGARQGPAAVSAGEDWPLARLDLQR